MKLNKKIIAQTIIELNQLAMHEIDEKNYQKATNYFTQSLVLENNLGMKAQMAESFYNLATTFYLMENYEKALEKGRIAEILFKDLEMKDHLTRAKEIITEINKRGYLI